MAALAVAAGVALFAYYLGTSTHPPSQATAAQGTPGPAATATPQSTAPPPFTPAAGGQTQTTPDGATITLLAYADHLQSVGGDASPPQGQFYAAVALRVCAASGTPTSVTPFDFVLVEPDHSTVDTISTGPGVGRQPELLMSELPPGQCVTGWLSYQVTVTAVSLTDTAGNLSWPVG